MILARTPLRISLGGGGTDLPAYASRFGGYLITAAIDKFVYVVLNRRFEVDYIVKYAKTEQVARLEEIQHPVVRAVFKLLDIQPGIEMTSFMDVPSRTGLGSSSTFTVALLQAAYTLNSRTISTRELAETAVYVEREILQEAGGKQDQFIAAYGGLQVMSIREDGSVDIEPLPVEPDILHDLEGRLVMFYTGVQRESAHVQASVSARIRSDSETTSYLHRVKDIGVESAATLQRGNLDEFGRLMDLHWHEKRQLSDDVSSSAIDAVYALGKQHGALGGKLIGAGGGGYILFYCRGDRTNLRTALAAQGLREMRFRFEMRGSMIVANLS